MCYSESLCSQDRGGSQAFEEFLEGPKAQNASKLVGKDNLSWRTFRIFFIFSARGGERGSPKRQEGRVSVCTEDSKQGGASQERGGGRRVKQAQLGKLAFLQLHGAFFLSPKMPMFGHFALSFQGRTGKLHTGLEIAYILAFLGASGG